MDVPCEPNFALLHCAAAKACLLGDSRLYDFYIKHQEEIEEYFRDIEKFNNDNMYGYILDRDASWDDYNDLNAAFCDKRNVHYWLRNKDIIIYELKSTLHSQLVKIFDYFLCYRYNEQINLGNTLEPIKAIRGKCLTFPGQNIARVPDCAYQHMNSQSSLPPVIVEVGYAENLAQLHHVAHDIYLMSSTFIRAVIVVKVDYKRYEDDNHGMLVVLYLRDSNTDHVQIRVINIGNQWPSHELHRQLQTVPALSSLPVEVDIETITIPAGVLFYGTPDNVPSNLDYDCKLKLSVLREEALEGLRATKEVVETKKA
jgi:hypothetical protein